MVMQFLLLTAGILGGLLATRGSSKDATPNDIMGIVVGVIVGFVLFMGYGKAVADHYGPDFAEPVFQEEQNLASLRSHDATTGSFGFLGVGSIEDELFYSYYRLDQGAYRPEKISGDKNDIWVHEEARIGGRVEIYDLTFRTWWHWVLFTPPEGDAYHFYIPEESIQRDFVLE